MFTIAEHQLKQIYIIFITNHYLSKSDLFHELKIIRKKKFFGSVAHFIVYVKSYCLRLQYAIISHRQHMCNSASKKYCRTILKYSLSEEGAKNFLSYIGLRKLSMSEKLASNRKVILQWQYFRKVIFPCDKYL